ncbi:aconitate hydratase AcnA [Microbacterium aoyamense]|uniref:Aconitate hydratase AcnA n=1 Tax=Microbacterium aoyamense TaxID=344166 RepID=A0ABP5ALW2_9MICO|nr:aconitate hydratase [Microbacterium aoyamense]
MTLDTFGARGELSVDGRTYRIHRIDAVDGASTLPYSLKVLLENALRTEDGINVTADHIRSLGQWRHDAEPDTEVLFTPARVLTQDLSGIPAVMDLVLMRDVMREWGGDPSLINPLTPVELVIDHSAVVEAFGTRGALARNIDVEYEQNSERYLFLRWAQTAFADLKVVPPGTGIVHQVNLEYLARTVMVTERDGIIEAFPDTCVGTDSHTPMVNGMGVLGWGIGGIEAEAAMLGQPISMLIPRVVGFKLRGAIPDGTTATDVVLTITQTLREHGVVGKFVEFYGEGVGAVPLANRATIGNMSPEFGSTVAIFPIDEITLDYLRLTGRPPEQVALVEAYAREQGLWHDPSFEARYSEYVELDLSTIVPSIAGPKRPQDRIPLSEAKDRWRSDVRNYVVEGHDVEETSLDRDLSETLPASDPLPPDEEPEARRAPDRREVPSVPDRPSRPVSVTLDDGARVELDHGSVVISAITSCTNTSNPSVMLGAALLAKNAVERGLSTKPWVKTSMAPGSQVVSNYYDKAGMWPYLEKLGYYLVGYGCTTCSGNSGPLPAPVSAAIAEEDLAVAAVLSGNRNFEGRINPDVKMNYIASPPLVIAYGIAGRMDFDFESDPLGVGDDGEAVYLRDIWPSPAEIDAVIASSVSQDLFEEDYADVFVGDDRWRSLPTPSGDTFAWDPRSTYVRQPPYFAGMRPEPEPVQDIRAARVLAMLGDSVTTDHISPAGSIKVDSPAGRYLIERGVERRDFNSYGARRGNHEVMIRGTFANIRLRNQLLDGIEGGFTRNFLTGEQETIYDAAVAYGRAGVPLVVLGGAEYGTGSSRDWAAKGTRLLGVKAVIAESFERIHRSNLIGMGVLPLQYPPGVTAATLGLDGTETFSISGISEFDSGRTPRTVRVSAAREDATTVDFDAVVRVDTPGEAAYFRNGGILPYVLRTLIKGAQSDFSPEVANMSTKS